MVARIVFGILVAATAGSCQTPDGLPKFDRISIKTAGPQVPGQPISGSTGSAREGHITWIRRNLPSLLMEALGVDIDQLDIPQWMYDVKAYSYNISVSMPRDTPDREMQLMMQSLLAERFHLVLHHETRNFLGYDLVVADGGPLMKEAQSGQQNGSTSGGGRVEFRMTGTTMPHFASELGRLVRESNGEVLEISVPRVVDKTGLTRVYPIALEFRGWMLLPGAPLTDAQRASVKPEVATLPDLFGALEAQLGLKLVKVADVPLDVLVIDHADSVADEN